jgi:hypothetical protein
MAKPVFKSDLETDGHFTVYQFPALPPVDLCGDQNYQIVTILD